MQVRLRVSFKENNMRKLFFIELAVILAAVLSFTGCEFLGPIFQTDEAKIAEAKDELAIPAETDSNLDLPTVLNGVAISWVSSNEAVITVIGIVTRQANDTLVTLTATLTLGNASSTKEFIVTVKAAVPDDPTDPPAIIEEAAELVELSHWGYNSDVSANRVEMTYPDKNFVFNCTVDNGHFRSKPDLNVPTKNASVNYGDIIYWRVYEIEPDGTALGNIDHSFIEIVLKFEEHIIGYVVVEAHRAYGTTCRAKLLKSILFPQVSGVYQNISEEYVETAIEKTKNESSEKPTEPAVFEEVEAELIQLSLWVVGIGQMPNRVEMKYPNENTIFNCTVDNGYFRSPGSSSEFTKNKSIHYCDVICWVDSGTDHAFIEIVLKLEEHIIGYAVIEAWTRKGYHVNLLKSILFPQADGVCQNVTEEYVKTAIERIKNESQGGASLCK